MARKEDPEDLDPYSGDPWHPAWEPEEREVGENDIDTPAEGSSVERGYEALRSLGDDNVEVTEPASPGVVADVGSLQTSGGGTESAADVAVAWDTTNVDEERRREAAAPTHQPGPRPAAARRIRYRLNGIHAADPSRL